MSLDDLDNPLELIEIRDAGEEYQLNVTTICGNKATNNHRLIRAWGRIAYAHAGINAFLATHRGPGLPYDSMPAMMDAIGPKMPTIFSSARSVAP
jgi:hypothetical protein